MLLTALPPLSGRLWTRRACWRMGSAQTRSATSNTRGDQLQPCCIFLPPCRDSRRLQHINVAPMFTPIVAPIPMPGQSPVMPLFRFWPSAERFSLSAFRSAGLDDDHIKEEEPPSTTGYSDAFNHQLPPPLGEFRRLQESPQRYAGHREGLANLKRRLQ